MIFGFVTVATCLLSAAYWRVSQLDFDTALKFQKVSEQTTLAFNSWEPSNVEFLANMNKF